METLAAQRLTERDHQIFSKKTRRANKNEKIIGRSFYWTEEEVTSVKYGPGPNEVHLYILNRVTQTTCLLIRLVHLHQLDPKSLLCKSCKNIQ